MMESDGISHDVLGKRFVGKTNRGDEYYLEYNIFEGKVLDAHHTFVPVNGRGKRLAEKLTFACFEFAKKEQLLVQPSCSYISSTFLKKYLFQMSLTFREQVHHEIPYKIAMGGWSE